MAGRAQIPTKNSALIAMIADEVNIVLLFGKYMICNTLLMPYYFDVFK